MKAVRFTRTFKVSTFGQLLLVKGYDAENEKFTLSFTAAFQHEKGTGIKQEMVLSFMTSSERDACFEGYSLNDARRLYIKFVNEIKQLESSMSFECK